jgi:hypothetical protein
MNFDPDYALIWPGLEVKHLILATDDFIIWLDDSLDIDWKTKPAFDARARGDESKHHAILNRASLLESIPATELRPEVALKCKRMIGEAIARCFEEGYDKADEMLDIAERFINTRNEELARFWCLSSTGLFGGFTAIVAVILWLFRISISGFIGHLCFILILAMIAGAWGAIFSLILRIGRIQLDYSAGKILYWMESISRIVVGMISAFLLTLAVHAGVLFPIFKAANSENIAIILIGLIAGYSERLASTFIGAAENKILQKIGGAKRK